jgi:hypothetical protein
MELRLSCFWVLELLIIVGNDNDIRTAEELIELVRTRRADVVAGLSQIVPR